MDNYENILDEDDLGEDNEEQLKLQSGTDSDSDNETRKIKRFHKKPRSIEYSISNSKVKDGWLGRALRKKMGENEETFVTREKDNDLSQFLGKYTPTMSEQLKMIAIDHILLKIKSLLSTERKIEIFQRLIKVVNQGAEEPPNYEGRFVKFTKTEEKLAEELHNMRSIFFQVAVFWIQYEYRRSHTSSYWNWKYLGTMIQLFKRIESKNLFQNSSGWAYFIKHLPVHDDKVLTHIKNICNTHACAPAVEFIKSKIFSDITCQQLREKLMNILVDQAVRPSTKAREAAQSAIIANHNKFIVKKGLVPIIKKRLEHHFQNKDTCEDVSMLRAHLIQFILRVDLNHAIEGKDPSQELYYVNLLFEYFVTFSPDIQKDLKDQFTTIF